MNIWLVNHPTDIYVEDVKKLAKENKLKIIDSRFGSEIPAELIAKNPPKLTLKNQPEGNKPDAGEKEKKPRASKKEKEAEQPEGNKPDAGDNVKE